MSAVETVADVVTENRTYYTAQVVAGASGSFVGNVCWDCHDMLPHAAVKVIICYGCLVTTVIDTIVDNKTEQTCQHRMVEQWAYGAVVDPTCLGCIKGEFTEGQKHSYDMASAKEKEASLGEFLAFYSSSGAISGKIRKMISRSCLASADGYAKAWHTCACGLNAIDIC